MCKTICFEDIHPFIRYMRLYKVIPDNIYSKSVKAYDYRFFYVYKGKGIIELDSKNYNIEKGHLFLWRPGVEYGLISDHQHDFELLQVNFDFTLNNKDKSFRLAPGSTHDFKDDDIIEIMDFSDLDIFNRPIFLKNMEIVENTLLEMKTEFDIKKRFYNQKISSLFLMILNNIARVTNLINIDLDQQDHKVDKIIRYIHENYNKEINNMTIGKLFNFHPNYIIKLMVQNTGKSLHQYILDLRISKAIDLIHTTNMQISEIAYAVGFNDVNHFTRLFKNKTGSNPLSFKNNGTRGQA